MARCAHRDKTVRARGSGGPRLDLGPRRRQSERTGRKRPRAGGEGSPATPAADGAVGRAETSGHVPGGTRGLALNGRVRMATLEASWPFRPGAGAPSRRAACRRPSAGRAAVEAFASRGCAACHQGCPARDPPQADDVAHCEQDAAVAELEHVNQSPPTSMPSLPRGGYATGDSACPGSAASLPGSRAALERLGNVLLLLDSSRPCPTRRAQRGRPRAGAARRRIREAAWGALPML
jgi:hypothetical protein